MLGKLGNIDEISKSDMSEWLKRSWEAAVLPLNYAREMRWEYFCLLFPPLSSSRRVRKIDMRGGGARHGVAAILRTQSAAPIDYPPAEWANRSLQPRGVRMSDALMRT